jgi:hypothetical protein
MPEYAISGNSAFRTCAELLGMGASETDKNDIRWIPPDQMMQEHEGSVALKPDPESLRVFNFKRSAQALASKAKRKISGPAKRPADALNRMMNRSVVKGLMNRPQHRGLMPRGPNNYAALKQPTPARMRQPQVTALSIRRIPVNRTNIRLVARAALKLLTAAASPEPAATIAADIVGLIGPKPRGRAFSFG